MASKSKKSGKGKATIKGVKEKKKDDEKAIGDIRFRLSRLCLLLESANR